MIVDSRSGKYKLYYTYPHMIVLLQSYPVIPVSFKNIFQYVILKVLFHRKIVFLGSEPLLELIQTNKIVSLMLC